MNKPDTKKRVQIISLIFITALLVVWGLFYFLISNYLSDRTNRQIVQAANQIIERFGGEFSQIERLTHSLSQNADVRILMQEQNPHVFFRLAGEIGNKLDTKIINSDFIDNIILFGADNNFYRLYGRLGNRSCMRVANILNTVDMPGHFSVELENRHYIGYVDAIGPGTGIEYGAVVILIEEERVLELLRTYDQSGLLLVAISANNEVITANTNRLELFSPDSLHQPMIHSRLGITPYRISVAADEGYISSSLMYFTVVAIITAVIFSIVLLTYTGILNRSFKNQEKQKALVFSLKKQINAHFTINTLNTVRILVESGEFEKADTVVLGLTSLVRYAYDRDELINIWDELDILEDYIVIMNSRYNGKLETDFDFDDRLMNYYMPRMLLQPVIENSIVHGFKEMETGCYISVTAKINGNRVDFSIIDNGCGMTGDEISKLSEKQDFMTESTDEFENIALLNIKNRLYHYFGENGQLKIAANDNSGTVVTISMPLLSEKGGV